MAKVIISEILKNEIIKKFKRESKKIFKQMYSLRKNPKKGKFLANVGKIVIKELRYNKGFRFYFITEGYKLKVLKVEELSDLLIKFIRMSDKNSQQKVIDEIKNVLRKLGEEGF